MTKKELEELGFVDKDGDGYDDNDGEQPDKQSKRRRSERNEDKNLDPMDVFARNECEKFLQAVDASDFASSRKILRGLGIGSSEDVYLIHDDTLFKSGKNGFAITESGIYCREMSEGSAHFVSWSEFAEGGAPRLDNSYLRQGDTSVFYLSGNSDLRENELFNLFDRLYNHALETGA